jgi:hypothetical protein
MTKIYQGGDTYHLHMLSGKVLDVTTDEINEIAEESPIVEDLREEVAEAKNEYNRARGYASDACGEIDELESYLMSSLSDMDLDEVLRLVQSIKSTVERI